MSNDTQNWMLEPLNNVYLAAAHIVTIHESCVTLAGEHVLILDHQLRNGRAILELYLNRTTRTTPMYTTLKKILNKIDNTRVKPFDV